MERKHVNNGENPIDPLSDGHKSHVSSEPSVCAKQSRRKFLSTLSSFVGAGVAIGLSSAHKEKKEEECPYRFDYRPHTTIVSGPDGETFTFLYNLHERGDGGEREVGRMPDPIPADTAAGVLELNDPWGLGLEDSACRSPEAHFSSMANQMHNESLIKFLHTENRPGYLAYPFLRGPGQFGEVFQEITLGVTGAAAAAEAAREHYKDIKKGTVNRRTVLKDAGAAGLFAVSASPLLGTLSRLQNLTGTEKEAEITSRAQAMLLRFHPLFTSRSFHPDKLLKAAIYVMKLRYLAKQKDLPSIATVIGQDHPEIAEMFRFNNQELLQLILEYRELIRLNCVDPSSIYSIAEFMPIQPGAGEPRNTCRWRQSDVLYEPNLETAIRWIRTGQSVNLELVPDLLAACQMNHGRRPDNPY